MNYLFSGIRIITYAMISTILRLIISTLHSLRQKISWCLAFLIRLLDDFACQLENEKENPFLQYLLCPFSNVDDFEPPSVEQVDKIFSLYERLIDPQFFGFENIPTDKPILFIANHALFAIEYPLLLNKVYKEKGIFLRAAGDKFHKYLPYWPLFKFFGAFDGSRESCSQLMEGKKNLLIFPGGGREVLKRKNDPKYELHWKERVGFARLAIKYGYQIVPIVSYGSEDMIDILFDIPLQPILNRELYLPIPSPPSLDKIQRIYFSFGKPISTDQYNGDFESDENCKHLRDATRNAILEQMNFLKQKQDSDPDSKRMPQLLKKTKFF